MIHLIKILIVIVLILSGSGVCYSQVVIDVRSDTSTVIISDSVIIVKRQLLDNPSDTNLRLKLAEIYLQRDLLDEAEQEVNQVLNVDSLSVQALTAMGRVYLQREPGKIIPFERLKEILKKDNKSKAIKKFQAALALDANYSPARYFLARSYLAKGSANDLVRAKDEFTALLMENPDYQDVRYQLGYTYQKMGNYDEALKLYQQTRHKKADFARANVRMAELYYDTGNAKSATESFFEGIEELEDRELLDYLFDEQKIIMTREELGEFENAPYSVKKNLIKKFWKQRDPDPSTSENERLMEHFRRVKFARETFHFTAPPYYDDRGKIYIKYGPPDERHNMPVGNLQAKDNESWTYESIEKGLVFDFVSDGGYFHEVQDLTDAALSGTNYASRLYIASQLYSNRSNLSDAYASLSLSFSHDKLNDFHRIRNRALARHRGEIYRYDPRTNPFPFVTKFAQFRGDEDKTDVELYSSFPGIAAKFEQANGQFLNISDFFIEVQDSNFNSVEREQERFSIKINSTENMGDRHFLLQHNLQLVPGKYSLALILSSPDNSAKTIQKKHLVVRDFTSDSLMISDIQLSLDISESTDTLNPRIIKRNLKIKPYPFSRIAKNRPIHLYFEIYNLALDDENQSRFSVDYQLKTLKATRNFWQKTIGGIPGIFSRQEKKMITTTVQREGDQDTAFEHIAFDLKNLDLGLTELQIEITDLIRQQKAKVSAEFTLIK